MNSHVVGNSQASLSPVDFDNEQLVEHIKNGHKQAENQLVERYWRSLYFILTRRAQDPDLAADIAQDTFVVVLQHVRNNALKNPAALSAYIRNTGVNLLIAHFRKEARRDTKSNSDMTIKVPDDSPDLYRLLYGKDAIKLVRQVIDEMNVPRDRDLLTQYYLYEKDKSEICTLLDLGADNFDKVLYRARARLKQLVSHKMATSSADITSLNSLIILTLMTGLYGAWWVGEKQKAKKISIEVEELQSSSHWVINGRILQGPRNNHFKPSTAQRSHSQRS